MANVKLDKRVLERMILQVPQKVSIALDKEAETIVNNVKLSFGSSPPGRVYRRGTSLHVASVARYPPNVDTGFLRANIRWTTQERFVRWIQADTDYAQHLELGTSRMAPRPFLAPEMMRAYTRLPEVLRRALTF